MTQQQVTLLFIYLGIIVSMLLLVAFGVWGILLFGVKIRKDS